MKSGHHWMMAAALCVVALGLVGCWDSVSWHQKMIVVVDTPDGERTASSVVSLQADRGIGQIPGISSGALVVGKVRGEAVVLDLGGGRFLFALLKGETASGDVRNNAKYVFSHDRVNALAKLEKVKALPLGTKGELDVRGRPLLITFDDITKPETVKRVYPDNLAATFGEGYAMKSITLEITDEPVTTGRVEKVLGWWCDYRGKYFVDRYADQVSNEFARDISAGQFRIGGCS